MFRKYLIRCAVFAAVVFILLDVTMQAGNGSDPNQPAPTGHTPTWSVDLHAFGFGLDQERTSSLFGNHSPYFESSLSQHAIALRHGSGGRRVWNDDCDQNRRPRANGDDVFDKHLARCNRKVIAQKQWAWRPDRIGPTSIAATPGGRFLLPRWISSYCTLRLLRPSARSSLEAW